VKVENKMPISAEQEKKIKEIYSRKKGWHTKFTELSLKNLVNYYYDNSSLSGLSNVRADPFTFIVSALEDADEKFSREEMDSYLSSVLQIPTEAARAKYLEEAEKVKPTKPATSPAVPTKELEETIRRVVREELSKYAVPAEKPRAPDLEDQECPICGAHFYRDLDLEERVRMYEVSHYCGKHTGKTYKVPLLDFPEEFYMLCPDCRYKRFGYRDIYDALGMSMFRTKYADRLTTRYVTVKILRKAGLTEEEIEKVKEYAKKHEEEIKRI
jgi:hypothetical protein